MDNFDFSEAPSRPLEEGRHRLLLPAILGLGALILLSASAYFFLLVSSLSASGATGTTQGFAEIQRDILSKEAQHRQDLAAAQARHDANAADYEPYTVTGPRITQAERRDYEERLVEEAGINRERKGKAGMRAATIHAAELKAMDKKLQEEQKVLLSRRAELQHELNEKSGKDRTTRVVAVVLSLVGIAFACASVWIYASGMKS